MDASPIKASNSIHSAIWTLGYDTSDDATCYAEDGEDESDDEEDEEEEEDEVDEKNNNIQLSPMLSRYAETRRQTWTPPLKLRGRANSLKEKPRLAMAKQRIFGPLAERGRLYAGRNMHRFIAKTGELNMSFKNVGRHWRYLADIFTTLMDIRWRYDILLFVLGFIFSWLSFAVMW